MDSLWNRNDNTVQWSLLPVSSADMEGEFRVRLASSMNNNTKSSRYKDNTSEMDRYFGNDFGNNNKMRKR